jgi:hypothetical protein
MGPGIRSDRYNSWIWWVECRSLELLPAQPNRDKKSRFKALTYYLHDCWDLTDVTEGFALKKYPLLCKFQGGVSKSEIFPKNFLITFIHATALITRVYVLLTGIIILFFIF